MELDLTTKLDLDKMFASNRDIYNCEPLSWYKREASRAQLSQPNMERDSYENKNYNKDLRGSSTITTTNKA